MKRQGTKNREQGIRGAGGSFARWAGIAARRSSCSPRPSPSSRNSFAATPAATTSTSTSSPGSIASMPGVTAFLIRTGRPAPTTAPASRASSSIRRSPGCWARRSAHSSLESRAHRAHLSHPSPPPALPRAPSLLKPSTTRPPRSPAASPSSPASRSSPPTSAPPSPNSPADSGFRFLLLHPISCPMLSRLSMDGVPQSLALGTGSDAGLTSEPARSFSAALSTVPPLRWPSRSPAPGSRIFRSASWPATCSPASRSLGRRQQILGADPSRRRRGSPGPRPRRHLLAPRRLERNWVDISQATQDPGYNFENNWLFAHNANPLLALHDVILHQVSWIAVSMIAVALVGIVDQLASRHAAHRKTTA